VSAVRESEAHHPKHHSGLGEQTRRAMRVATTEGLFAAASDNFAGSYVSLYALSLGANNAQIGMVNALPALLTNVLQIPFAIWSDRINRRKALWVVGGLGLRVAWLPIALIPLLGLSPGAGVALYLALLALRSVFAAAATPAWTSLMADMTPRRMRGAYFSNRNIIVNLSALLATLISGAVLRVFEEPMGYQVTFLIAAAFGAAAAYTTTKFPDLDAPKRSGAAASSEEKRPGQGRVRSVERALQREEENARAWSREKEKKRALRDGFGARELLASVRKEKSFATYSLASALWNFGVTLPQPLFAVYFVEVLGGTASFWGVASAATFLTTVLGQRYWGGLSDRVGGRNVLITSGTIAAVIPGLWFVAFRPEHALWINLVSGLGWAGFNLAAFNLLLEVTPDKGRTTYVAGYNALIGLSQFAGPLLGGIAADMIGARPIFFGSTLIRLVAWWIFAYQLKTAYDKPYDWRAFVPMPKGGIKRLGLELLELPARIVRKVQARRLERKLRAKIQQRLVESALQNRAGGESGESAADALQADPSGAESACGPGDVDRETEAAGGGDSLEPPAPRPGA